jgi:hypothetical protein
LLCIALSSKVESLSWNLRISYPHITKGALYGHPAAQRLDAKAIGEHVARRL